MPTKLHLFFYLEAQNEVNNCFFWGVFEEFYTLIVAHREQQGCVFARRARRHSLDRGRSEPAQSQRRRHDRHRRQRHGRSGQRGRKANLPNRIQDAGGNRNGDGVVGKCEEEVESDAPEGAMADGKRGDYVAQVVLHQHNISCVDSHVCAAGHCNAAIGFDEGCRVGGGGRCEANRSGGKCREERG